MSENSQLHIGLIRGLLCKRRKRVPTVVGGAFAVFVMVLVVKLLVNAAPRVYQYIRNQADVDVTSEEEFQLRKNRLQSVCSRIEKRKTTSYIFTNDQSGTLYCLVPKTGCTFWKLLFHAAKIHHGGLTLDNVFSVSRKSIHSMSGAYGRPFSPISDTFNKYPVRFMMTRDPFSRVLSSYLDKFYLPDFWVSKSAAMCPVNQNSATDFLTKHFAELRTSFPIPSEDKLKRCCKYLPFSDFVEKSLQHREPHWDPLHRLCDPCALNLTYIGHMKTLNQDSKAILGHMNYSHLLDALERNKQVEKELQMITTYNFDLLQKPSMRKCIGPLEMAQRVWNNFVWRGYIHPDSVYVSPRGNVTTNDVIKDDFFTQLWSARKLGMQAPQLMKKAKENFLRDAYLSLPDELFQKFITRYKLDFDFFDFSKEKENIVRLTSRRIES